MRAATLLARNRARTRLSQRSVDNRSAVGYDELYIFKDHSSSREPCRA